MPEAGNRERKRGTPRAGNRCGGEGLVTEHGESVEASGLQVGHARVARLDRGSGRREPFGDEEEGGADEARSEGVPEVQHERVAYGRGAPRPESR
jgi:hypothetical protein